MRLELNGTPNTPVLASAITPAIIARSNELYGSLPGIEEAATKIADGLLEIAAKEKGEYQIVVSLDDDGGYGFYVYALQYLATRPRCRSWDGPGYYLLEAGSLGGGCPFNKHMLACSPPFFRL